MGTITGVNDLDPVRWKNSQWRNLQVPVNHPLAFKQCNFVSMYKWLDLGDLYSQNINVFCIFLIYTNRGC